MDVTVTGEIMTRERVPSLTPVLKIREKLAAAEKENKKVQEQVHLNDQEHIEKMSSFFEEGQIIPPNDLEQ